MNDRVKLYHLRRLILSKKRKEHLMEWKYEKLQYMPLTFHVRPTSRNWTQICTTRQRNEKRWKKLKIQNKTFISWYVMHKLYTTVLILIKRRLIGNQTTVWLFLIFFYVSNRQTGFLDIKATDFDLFNFFGANLFLKFSWYVLPMHIFVFGNRQLEIWIFIFLSHFLLT